MPLRPDNIAGIGIDTVTLSRFSAFVGRHEERLGEIFTRRELAGAASRRQRELYLATRWALKEAVLKALGVGWRADVQWTDVEALGDLFSPLIQLHGAARTIAERCGRRAVVGSACADGDCAMAIAVLVGTGPARTQRANLEIPPG